MLKLAISVVTFLTLCANGQPLLAQAAVSEPGAFAFYHPEADVLNAGRPTYSHPADALAYDARARVDTFRREPNVLYGPHRRSSRADRKSP